MQNVIVLKSFIKVARVVNLKLVFTDYNLIVLIK